MRLIFRGENLGVNHGKRPQWYEGAGLYPIQAMIQPIALRFKYHFQGSKNTNRVDKASCSTRRSNLSKLISSQSGLSPASSIVSTSTKRSCKSTSSP
jgi:hypothetical protein